MQDLRETSERLQRFIERRRLVETVTKLVSVPSPTGNAGEAADCLTRILRDDGFLVERPAAGHDPSPAVVVRFDTKRPGPTLQFNGHLDTVHLPFVPPRVEGDRVLGSGASDMKSGVAAALEALRALRESGELKAGSVLFTAHDLHEAPWGRGEQLDALIKGGCIGDGVLLPEPLSDRLPVVGRGAATWKVTIRRPGPPVHEVLRPDDEPSVIEAGAELVRRLIRLDERLGAQSSDPLAGKESIFIGQVHSGEIYNQYPDACWLEGTRRWLPGTIKEKVEKELRGLASDLEQESRTRVEVDFRCIRDAFFLEREAPLVQAFLRAYEETAGRALPIGPKPFVDDGNSFWAKARIPAITHGPRAGGQHTLDEWVSVDDLLRVAHLYALTAVLYTGGEP